MKKAFALNLYLVRYNTFFYLSLAMVLFYLLLSFGLGVDLHFEYLKSGLSEQQLLDFSFSNVKSCATMSILFIVAAFYVLPLIDANNDGFKGASMTILPASLPVKRIDLAVSKMIYTGLSSIILTLLAITAISAGFIYTGGVEWNEVGIVMRSFLVMGILDINVLALLSTALFLSIKKFLLPAFLVIVSLNAVIMLLTPDFFYGLISSQLFWPVFIALLLLIEILIGVAGVKAFVKRDI